MYEFEGGHYNVPHTEGLRQQECVVGMVLEAEGPRSRHQASDGLLSAFGIPWHVDTSLDLHLHLLMVLSLSVSKFPPWEIWEFEEIWDVSHIRLSPTLMTSL